MAGGNLINHYGAVKIRVTGDGNLKLSLISLDDVYTLNLTDIDMPSATNKLPNVLSNFMQPKARLKIYTTEMNDVFLIKQITVYTRPVFTSYPQ